MALLSHDLRGLKIWFDQLLDGCEMTYEGAAAFSKQLGATIDKAERLEVCAVDQAVRLTRAQLAAPNVILFPAPRHPETATDAPDGDAA